MKNNKFEIVNYIGSTLLVLSYIPQIYQNQVTKNVNSLSLSFFCILAVGLACIGANAYDIFRKTGRKAFLIGQALNVLCALIIIIQILIYRV